MKIRIKGNSLRLRLTQSEVQQLSEEQVVSETIQFSPTQRLTYQLSIKSIDQPKAIFQDHLVEVQLPLSVGSDWANSEQVGIQHTQTIDDQNELSLLIEKDFQCLIKRPGEEDADTFPNPLAEPNKS